jgi:hypothetical protein
MIHVAFGLRKLQFCILDVCLCVAIRLRNHTFFLQIVAVRSRCPGIKVRTRVSLSELSKPQIVSCFWFIAYGFCSAKGSNSYTGCTFMCCSPTTKREQKGCDDRLRSTANSTSYEPLKTSEPHFGTAVKRVQCIDYRNPTAMGSSATVLCSAIRLVICNRYKMNRFSKKGDEELEKLQVTSVTNHCCSFS